MKFLRELKTINSIVFNGFNQYTSTLKQSQRPFSNANIKSWVQNKEGSICQVILKNVGSSGVVHQTSCCRFYSTLVNLQYNYTQRLRTLLFADIRTPVSTTGLPLQFQPFRMKSNKKRHGSSNTDSESDSDEDDDALAADDFDAPAKFKVIKIHTASTRADAIISNSLNVSRNRLEEVFYGPGLLLNGAKMLKKSAKMEEGDYVDLVVDKLDNQLKVKRVKIIKIYPERTNTEKLNVKVRVWKNPFLINNPDDGRRSS